LLFLVGCDIIDKNDRGISPVNRNLTNRFKLGLK
jgi:hypothetical protein